MVFLGEQPRKNGFVSTVLRLALPPSLGDWDNNRHSCSLYWHTQLLTEPRVLWAQCGMQSQHHRCNLEGPRWADAPPIFFLLKNGLVRNVWNLHKREGEGCRYITDWFKQILPIFLTWFLNKLKFLTPMVDSAHPSLPIVISQVMPMHNTIPSALTFAIQGAALYYSEILDTSSIFSWLVVYYKNLTACRHQRSFKS